LPQIICPELPAFETGDLDSVRESFQNAASCILHQGWLAKPETDFAPAIVRTGSRAGSLLVFAELTDVDIFTRATKPYERLWELGDTFEIFLRPVEQESYVEFHIAPNNLRLQLRFADADAVEIARKTGSLENALIRNDIFYSKTWVRPEIGRWFAFAEIPVKAVSENSKPLRGSEWFFSFSRYDYTCGRKGPVISSTSPHTKPDFHCQSEWGTMRF